MHDSDTFASFSYVARELGKRGVAFICVREPQDEEPLHLPVLAQEFRAAGGGVVIANESFTQESAERVIESGVADAVAWGREFIANPDLPRRFELGAPLNVPNIATFYAPGEEGYVDYPFLNEK